MKRIACILSELVCAASLAGGLTGGAWAAALTWDGNGGTAPNPNGGTGNWDTPLPNGWTGSALAAWNNITGNGSQTLSNTGSIAFAGSVAAGILAFGLESPPTVLAENGTWLGVNGNWSAAGTWSGGTVADGADFTANFTGVNITSNKTVTVAEV
jgi:hypothetical protein